MSTFKTGASTVPRGVPECATTSTLIYQHASNDRERAIGAAMSVRIEAVRAQTKATIGTRAPETTGSRGRRECGANHADQGRRAGERVMVSCLRTSRTDVSRHPGQLRGVA